MPTASQSRSSHNTWKIHVNGAWLDFDGTLIGGKPADRTWVIVAAHQLLVTGQCDIMTPDKTVMSYEIFHVNQIDHAVVEMSKEIYRVNSDS